MQVASVGYARIASVTYNDRQASPFNLGPFFTIDMIGKQVVCSCGGAFPSTRCCREIEELVHAFINCTDREQTTWVTGDEIIERVARELIVVDGAPELSAFSVTIRTKLTVNDLRAISAALMADYTSVEHIVDVFCNVVAPLVSAPQ